MSRTRQIIELTPPAVFREARPEKFTVSGFTCPECNGNGWYWGCERDGAPSSDGWMKVVCPVCGGNKVVSAEVTVHWRGKEVEP
jgi:excinuclease UvrABC ATPase subunit